MKPPIGVLVLLVLAARFGVSGPLGVAGDFNVFVTGNMTESNTDLQGRLAVGGIASLTNFGIGSGLSVDASRLDLIVGGTLNYQNGQIFAGSGRYVVPGTISGVGVPNGTLAQGASPINFATEANNLIVLSNSWNSLGGTLVTPNFSSLVIDATVSGLNVFRIAGFSGLNSITVNVAAGATVIVNVNATSDTMSNAGMTINGDVQKVLFNFSQATSLSLTSFQLKGSLLAPNAAFSFNNGAIDGNVIVASLTGTGESHNLLFNGTPPSAVPEPASLGLALLALTLILIRRRTARTSS